MRAMMQLIRSRDLLAFLKWREHVAGADDDLES
jgi:hypothetical protein